MANKVMRSFWLNALGLALVMALLVWGVGVSRLLVVVWLLVVNAWLFMLMAKDKRAAGRGGARTPEIVLLWLGFLGATPVLLFARKYLKHKTIKSEFVAAVWGVVALQAALLAWWMVR